MTFDNELHDRNSIRLKNYDYSKAGCYFITICTQNKLKLFGTVEKCNIVLNNAGQMVEKIWQELPNQFSNIQLHEFVIMPNHFHGIFEINKTINLGEKKTVSDIVGAFKSLTTNAFICGVKQNNWQAFEGKVWQRNFYEHIIRDRQDYLNTVDYILNNSKNWLEDECFL